MPLVLVNARRAYEPRTQALRIGPAKADRLGTLI
jgi:hypothetical protein